MDRFADLETVSEACSFTGAPTASRGSRPRGPWPGEKFPTPTLRLHPMEEALLEAAQRIDAVLSRDNGLGY